MKKNLPTYLILINFIFFYGCSSDSQEKKEIEIGYSALRISLPIFVAVQQGFFDEQELKVKLVRFDTAQPLMQALVAGNIKVAGYTALPITYNAMLRSSKQLYFITSLIEDSKHPISYLLLPENSPPEFSMKSLEGKTIGVLPTVAYHKWLEQILKENKINIDNVKITPIAPALQPSALQSGQVDAMFTNDPAATVIMQKKIGRRYSTDSLTPKYLGDPMLFGSFNADKQWADKNPGTFKKIVRALNKAVDYINKNPQAVKASMIPYIHESQQPFVNFYANAFYLRTDESNPDQFQQTVDDYLTMGIIPKQLLVEPLIIK